jgi:nicotinate phosphoribosyltransferase
VQAGQWLRAQGHELAGIRLDSGDLAYLSIEARKILDAAGFTKTFIVASNDLDEHLIASLKEQGAPIGVWGVGTKLVTAYDQPALGGVYKLTAIRRLSHTSPGNRHAAIGTLQLNEPEPGCGAGELDYKLKLSEQAIKSNTPGVLQVRRFQADNEFVADVIYDCGLGAPAVMSVVDPFDSTRRKQIPPGLPHEDLLAPIFRQGELVYSSPALERIRQRAQEQLAKFDAGIKRLANPHQYPVGLELGLHELKSKLIVKAREGSTIAPDLSR